MTQLMRSFTALMMAFALCSTGVKAELIPDAKSVATLTKLVAEKRQAIVLLTTKNTLPDVPRGAIHPYFGVFISEDGHALVSLAALTGKKKPEAFASKGGERLPIKLDKIHKLLPEQNIALVKFDHEPKVWLEVASKEPLVGEDVALVPVNKDDLWSDELNPIIGPIMASRTELTSNIRKVGFMKNLSLGAGLTFKQRSCLSPGCMTINAKAELIGFMGGAQQAMSQTILCINPLKKPMLPDLEAENLKAIPFPIPADLNPIDMYCLDDDYRFCTLAMAMMDRNRATRHMKILLERYPDSMALKLQAATEPILFNPDAPLVDLEMLKVDPKASKAEQVMVLRARAVLHMFAKDLKSMEKELKAATHPDLAPADYARDRLSLANMYVMNNKLEEAEKLYQQIYPLYPDSIGVIMQYQGVLERMGKADEAKRLRLQDKAMEVAKLYGLR